MNKAGESFPFEVTNWNHIPAPRYYDPAFHELEKTHLWPKVWQMACRLEEIPAVGNYVVYRNLNQSIIVIRTAEDTVKAYHNHCRHRGVELVRDRGKARGGFICPFHGWRWNTEGENTFVFAPEAYAPEDLCKDELALVPVRCETWGGCAFINCDPDAPPLIEALGEFAPHMDLFRVADLKVEWWLAAKIPCNWKLAMEAFQEGYHVATTHPQLLMPGVTNLPGGSEWVKNPADAIRGGYWSTVSPNPPGEVEPAAFVEMVIGAMKTLNRGMAGMIAAEEIVVAETLRGIDLPRQPREAAKAWRKAFNAALTGYYAKKGMTIGDLDAIDAAGKATNVNFCFPHFFLLPVHGAASSYRIRPLGPEECLFELWSLKRYPDSEHRPVPVPPVAKPHDDPSWPEIPAQDYSNLPLQQSGLKSGGFEFMRLSRDMEGVISNYHRQIDGYIRGDDQKKLMKSIRKVSGPIDRPVLDLAAE